MGSIEPGQRKNSSQDFGGSVAKMLMKLVNAAVLCEEQGSLPMSHQHFCNRTLVLTSEGLKRELKEHHLDRRQEIMGMLLQAFCPCGFESGLLGIQRGMFPGKVDYEPALCQACGELVTVDTLDKGAACRRCGGQVRFYFSDLALQQAPAKADEKTQQQSHLDQLSQADPFESPINYFCPKCHKMQMRFRDAGNWD